MARSIFDTLRNYCKKNIGKIFDVGYLSNMTFSYIDKGVFRKYVSRLVEECFLFPISKGIYSIGHIDDVDEKIIEHYTSNLSGTYAGKYLLSKMRLIEEAEITKEIYSLKTTGNKLIGNVKVKKLDLVYTAKTTYILAYLETMKYRFNMSDEEKEKCVKFFSKYPRQCYLELAKLLDQSNIYHQVRKYVMEKWNLLSEKAKLDLKNS